MKKKNLFTIALGVFALSIGLTSCKKDENCAIISGNGTSECLCVGDDGMTKAEFDKYVSYYKSHGYKVKMVKECKK